MKISDKKKVVIDYTSNGDLTNLERIFEGTYGDLRKIHGEDFNGFTDDYAFTFQKQDGTKEKVSIEKKITSHPSSSDSIQDEVIISPISKN